MPAHSTEFSASPLALECAGIAQELKLSLPIEVIAFSEEEGVRFGVPFIGSRAAAGRFDSALLMLKDADGIDVGGCNSRLRARSR